MRALCFRIFEGIKAHKDRLARRQGCDRIGFGWGGRGQKREEATMKRYLIFAALVPPLGGFWMLLSTSVMSGYWGHSPSLSEAAKLFAVFAKTVPYGYLFGIL